MKSINNIVSIFLTTLIVAFLAVSILAGLVFIPSGILNTFLLFYLILRENKK